MATKHFLGGRIILGTEFEGYKYRVFEPGTSTPKTTYTDSGLTGGNENSDPVVLDANGACQIWFNGNADVVFYTGADVVVYSDDDVNLEGSTSDAGSYNSALNGSFEDDVDGDGIPDSWTRTLYTGGAFTLDTTDQNHGDTSAKFTSTGTGGGYLTSTAKFAVTPSEPYELSWDMKSSDAGVRNVVQIFWYQADGTASSTASSTALDDSTTNQTSWAKETYNATAPADSYFAEIRLIGCHSSDATAGSTWFDNVEFLHAKTYGNRTNTGNVTQSGTLTMSAKSLWMAEGADVASANDCNIWTTDGNTVHVTGAVEIQDWGVAPQAGAWKLVIFDSTPLLTYDGTTNKLNTGGLAYTAVAGDRALVYAETTTSFVVTLLPLNRNLPPFYRTPISSTSGDSQPFTSIPSWVNRMTVMLTGVSTNGGSTFLLQLGDAGGIETTGYVGAAATITDGGTSGYAASTSGFVLGTTADAADVFYGTYILTRLNGNEWTITGTGWRNGTTDIAFSGSGNKTLSAELDRITVTTSGGDTWDNGTIALRYDN